MALVQYQILLFYGCSGFTGNLTIPSTDSSIGNQAFRNCSNITSVTNLRANPASINANVFQGVTIGNIPLYVPNSSVVAYQGANVWQNFKFVSDIAAAASLSSLTVSAGTLSPVFHADTTAYTVSVPNSTATIDLSATTVNPSATIPASDLGAQTLTVGLLIPKAG